MNDLRDDAERVMRRNFPRSEYYVRGLNQQNPGGSSGRSLSRKSGPA
jgi:hypothetical protein